MNNNNRGPGPIPDRWLYCPRKSETVIAERFIAFKTPLSKDFNNQMPLKCLFPPEMIFGWCKTIKIKLGMWIDLTNTKRFYDRKVVESQGIQYVKLQCRGHGETPSKEQTQSFIDFVDNFVREHPGEMIGVHCTHGFNRTGFLIVSYLVEMMDWSVETALACFAQSRPPGIYKQDYIDELYQRYENGEDPQMAPEMPGWCFDCDDESGESTMNRGQKRTYDEAHCSTQNNSQPGLNEFEDIDNERMNDVDDGNRNGNGTEPNTNAATQGLKKKRRREMVIKNATFMQGVECVHLVSDQPRLETVQRKVQDMCGWDKSGFPGSQPVSMDCENIEYLRDMPYRVSWKADGTRYMMLIDGRDEVYFIDRNNSCFHVENVSFLKAGEADEYLKDTLVDGEMVIDRYNGVSTPRYLIYDIVRINNRNIGREAFVDRSKCITKEIIEPRQKAFMSGRLDRSAEPFSVRLKDFWEIDTTATLLGEKFRKKLLHEPDGLIFQPAKEPYTAGVCPLVLKWKPPELNSVDFRLKIVVESGIGIITQKVGHLYVLGLDVPYAKIKITKQTRELDNKIIECFVNNRGQWEFLRERTDKTLPNAYKTAKAVFESICKPVTKDYLLNFIGCNGYRKDRERMPPPTTHLVHRTSHPQQHHQQEHNNNHRQRHEQQQY